MNKNSHRLISLGISSKIIVATTSLIVMVIIGLILLSSVNYYKNANRNTLSLTRETAYHYGSIIESELEKALDTARTLSSVFSSAASYPFDVNLDRGSANMILNNFIKGNRSFHSVSIIFEPDAYDDLDIISIDMPGSNEEGRFVPSWSRDSEGQPQVSTVKGFDDADSCYSIMKKNQAEYISDPHLISSNGRELLAVSINTPIKRDGTETILGMASIDITIDSLQEFIKDVKIGSYENTSITIYSHNGSIVASSNDSLLGQNTSDSQYATQIAEQILNQEAFNTVLIDKKEGRSDIFNGVPISIGKNNQKWMVGIGISRDEVYSQLKKMIIQIIWIGIATILLSISVLFMITRYLIKPILSVSLMLKEIAEGEGDLTKELAIHSDDEVGMLALSFNTFNKSLREIIFKIKKTSNKNQQITESLRQSTDLASSSVEQIISSSSRISGIVNSLDDQISTSSSSMDEISSTIEEFQKVILNQANAVSESTSSVEEMIASLKNVTRVTEIEKESTRILVEKAQVGDEKIRLSGDVIKEITRHIDEILEMTTIIQGISSQTNLLSMNAAIEAAHAGDAGRGFAVVADEIRKLSVATAKNSNHISGILKNVVEKITLAEKASDETTSVFNDISRKVIEVNRGLEEINANSTEISSGGEQILRAMLTLKDGSLQMEEESRTIGLSADSTRNSIFQVKEKSGDVVVNIKGIASETRDVGKVLRELTGFTDNLEKNSVALQQDLSNLKTN